MSADRPAKKPREPVLREEPAVYDRVPRSGATEIVGKEDGGRLLDSEARRLLGLSGEDFLRKWDAGEFDVDGPDHTKLISLYFLIPFAR